MALQPHQRQVGGALPYPTRPAWRGLVTVLLAVPVVAFAVVASNVSPGLAFMVALLLGSGEIWYVHRRPVLPGPPARPTPGRLHRLLFPAPEAEPWDPDAELQQLMRGDREVPPGT